MNRLRALLISCVLPWLLGACSSLSGSPARPVDQRGVTGSLTDGHARAAVRLLEKGDWHAAVGRATVAVALDPENAALHLLLATAHHRGFSEGQKAQGELAEAGYRVAINLDPTQPRAVRGLGTLYLDQQRFRSALAALSRAVQLDEEDGQTFHALAVAAYYAGDLRTALWAIRQATQALPDEAAVLRGAAVVHAALDLPDEAQAFALRYAGMHPDPRDGEALRKTLDRWRRQNSRILVAQADTAAAASPGTLAEGHDTGEPERGAAASVAPGAGASVTAAPAAVVAQTVPPGGAGGGAVTEQASREGGTPDQVAVANGPLQAGAPEVLARDWRDCKQHFSDYDFRDDGDPGLSASQGGGVAAGTPGGPSGDDETSPLRALPSPCRGMPAPRMVLVDAVILTTVEEDNRSNGVNLLDSLSVVLDASREVTRTLDNSGNWTTEVTGKRGYALGQGSAGVTYSLNIANAARNRVEVLARPTLVALDRKPSTFFSGSEITVPVQGNLNGSLQDKAVGTSLSVTPTMLDDDSLMLNTRASRSYFSQLDPGSIEQTLVTSRNTVTASVRMRYGQSLILSGLRESENASSHGGAPVLKDTPGLQYLFSRRVDSAKEHSILIVLTPRRVERFEDVLTRAGGGAAKDVPDPAFAPDAQRVQAQVGRVHWMSPNVEAILQAQRANALMKDYLIQRTDLGPLRAQSQSRFDLLLRDLRTLLYF